MSKTEFSTVCPDCGKDIIVSADIPNVNTESFPKVRSGLKPIGNVMVYKISSEEISNFIIQKARQYVPDVRMKVVPRYCEKKRKNKNINEPHRSYASLRIAFSDNVIKKDQDFGWFGSIGENGSNIELHPGILVNLIEKYKYNRKDIDSWLKNYKTLEELEETLGMTEAYINDIRMYTTPQRVKVDDNESWIIFSAAAENVINDMLTEVHSGKLPGVMQIKSVYPISKDIVEYVIYIHPSKMEVRENPHVRQILLGEAKPKK